MASPRTIAKRQARRFLETPTDRRLFLRQMGEEAHFQDLTSPAGAQGFAQFTPDTAAAVGLKNPHDPGEAYGAAAKLMRSYLDRYHGDWEKALTAYNAGPGRVGKPLYDETRGYISRILGGTRPTGGAKAQNGAGGAASAAGSTVELGTKKTFDEAGFEDAQRRTLLAGFLAKKHGPKSILFRSGLLSTTPPDRADFTDSELTSKVVPLSGFAVDRATTSPSSKRGRLIGKPLDRPGVPTRRPVIRFVEQVAGVLGSPIRLGTGTAHDRLTVNGNVSNHWEGDALDLPAAGKRNIAIGRAALIAAGMPASKARKLNGGLFNVGSYQIIFNTQEGGDHTDHVHVGRRR